MAPKATVQAPASLIAPRVVINYIHGGSIDDKHNSKRQRQRLFHTTSIREQISSIQCTFAKGSVRPVDDTINFPLIDVNRVLQPHEDVFILTLGVSEFNVQRILVYPSNSTDLLQMSAYRQMGYSPSALENPVCLLSGFNGATTTSLVDVVLPVQADLVTLSVRFLVINDLSPYNAIMRHAWLHKIKVIHSTYH